MRIGAFALLGAALTTLGFGIGAEAWRWLGSGARLREFGRGGHFPAMEEPDLLAGDIRAFFRKVRGVNPG